jgi:GAF domain-containing protein
MTFARRFQELTADADLWTALRELNAQIPYRYSAVFRFAGDDLRNVCLVDKRDPDVRRGPDQPITDSYCIFIKRSGKEFATEDSQRDARVEEHPKREAFHSYYGIPLIGRDGTLLGTVCHFDADPVRVTEAVVSSLDDVAPIIAKVLDNP